MIPKRTIGRQRFGLRNVKCDKSDPVVLQGFDQRDFVYHLLTGDVDENYIWFHGRKYLRIEHLLSIRCERNAEHNCVGLRKNLGQLSAGKTPS